jgi:hypothetical protein
MDKPTWTEISPGHFVLANVKEIDVYKKELVQ